MDQTRLSPVEEGLDVGAEEAAGTGQAEDGEEGGLGDADPGVGGGQLALGGGDIGTALEEIGGEAGGDGGGHGVPVGGVNGCQVKGGGVRAAEDGDGVLKLGAALGKGSGFGFGDGQLGLGAGGVQLAADAAVEAAAHETNLLVAQVNGAGDDADFGVEGAEGEVVLRDVGLERQ